PSCQYAGQRITHRCQPVGGKLWKPEIILLPQPTPREVEYLDVEARGGGPHPNHEIRPRLGKRGEVDAPVAWLPDIGKGDAVEDQRLDAVTEIEVPLDDGARRITGRGVDLQYHAGRRNLHRGLWLRPGGGFLGVHRQSQRGKRQGSDEKKSIHELINLC